VYKARDRRDQQIVAIKVMSIDSDDMTSLQREINILKTCKSDYVVGYKGAYEKDGNIWIVMEYCVCSLADMGRICQFLFSEEQIASIMKMSLLGLTVLHQTKKIHRDIKAGNILVDAGGLCKLADFGVSVQLDHTLSKRNTVTGTPYWIAPEVLQQSRYDFKADIWSLAITAIELAEGSPPLGELHYLRAVILIPKIDPPTLREPHKWSKDFNDFLKLCLNKDPTQRPTALQLLATCPFLLRAKDRTIIGELVDSCLPKIDSFRDEKTETKKGGTIKKDEEKPEGGTFVRISENKSSEEVVISPSTLRINKNQPQLDIIFPTLTHDTLTSAPSSSLSVSSSISSSEQSSSGTLKKIELSPEEKGSGTIKNVELLSGSTGSGTIRKASELSLESLRIAPTHEK